MGTRLLLARSQWCLRATRSAVATGMPVEAQLPPDFNPVTTSTSTTITQFVIPTVRPPRDHYLVVYTTTCIMHRINTDYSIDDNCMTWITPRFTALTQLDSLVTVKATAHQRYRTHGNNHGCTRPCLYQRACEGGAAA